MMTTTSTNGPSLKLPLAEPEAYLNLLSTIELRDERNHNDVPANAAHHVFLDQLALLCVSAARSEVYAISVQIKPTLATLYVTGNTAVPKHTMRHLKDVCNRLVAISKLGSSPRMDSPADSSWQDNIMVKRRELLDSVYKFCLPKILARLQKRDAEWHSYCQEYTKVFRHLNPTPSAEQIKDLHKIFLCFNGIHRTLNKTPFTFDEHLFAALTALAILMRSEALSNLIHQTDVVMARTSTCKHLYHAWGASETQLVGKWQLHLVIDKAADHFRCVDQLVKIAQSYRLSTVFSQTPKIIYVQPSLRQVVIDIEPIRLRHPSAFPPTDATPTTVGSVSPVNPSRRPPRPRVEVMIHPELVDQIDVDYDASPHCEMVLVNHFLSKQIIDVEPYIGVSRLSCLSCNIGLQSLAPFLRKHHVCSSFLCAKPIIILILLYSVSCLRYQWISSEGLPKLCIPSILQGPSNTCSCETCYCQASRCIFRSSIGIPQSNTVR